MLTQCFQRSSSGSPSNTPLLSMNFLAWRWMSALWAMSSSMVIAGGIHLAEPTGSSEPPDCVSGVFIHHWPAVAEPERWGQA